MKRFTLLVVLSLTSLGLWAQIPDGYYNSATGKTGNELKAALHEKIKGHTTISYQQIWSAFWSTDSKGNNVVWDMYSDGADYIYYYTNTNGNNQCGTYEQEGDCYNREHSWPKSWFSGGEDGIPGRDLHHIFPTDGYVNFKRSNLPFGEVNNATWTSENGSKLGPCKSSLGYTGTVFEPIDEYKGDFARAYFYMSTRYYTEDSDWGSSGMTTKANLKDWAVTMLLRWSDNDPVSQKEIDRNNAVYGIQGNRNPFIDHPEYAHIIWEEGWTGVTYNIACASVQHGTITAPATAVEGTMVTLSATPSQGYMLDSWNVYKEGDTSTTVSVSSNGTFTMPSFNVTVSATFVQNSTPYNIACVSGLAHGSISTDVSGATSGTTVTLSNTPANGYILYSYYVYKTGDVNTIVYSGTGSTFIMPAYNVTVSASFVQPSSYNYVKVTEAPSDWSGEYLIVYEDGNKAFNGGLTNLDNTNNNISVTISDNAIEANATTNAARFTIAKSGNNYTIKSASGYYIGQTSNNNGLLANQSTAYTNTISYNTTEPSINIIGSGGAYLRFNNGTNDQRFRYYKSSTYTSQQPVQLYKKTAAAAAPTHTILFNPNGASGTGYTQTVNEFVPTALKANAFTYEGYAFDSWNTESNGSGTSYFNGATVTLLNDLTLYAQWELLYTITLATVENGTITLSHSQAVEGDVVTLTPTPASGYEFDHWLVTDASNNPVAVTDNQFEMPASDVTVSAAFVYVGAPFVQQYHLVTSTDQLVAGRTYLIVNTAAGKALGTTQNSNNRAAANVTISNKMISSIGDDVCELTLGGESGAWTFYDANKNGYLYAAGGTGSNNYLKTQTALTDEGKWTIVFDNNNNATIKTIVSTVARHTIMYNIGNSIFSCYASGQQKVQLFIRSEEYNHTESETIAKIFSFDKHTVCSGATLTVSGTATCNDASHLILEDGAQLIHHNDGVKALMKKSVTGYVDNTGWYTLANPFTDLDLACLTTANYDLYTYVEDADLEWYNYKAHPNDFVLNPAYGYLYAHNPGTVLRMAGTLNNGDYTETVDLSYASSNTKLKGFNLLGNPTAHDINFTKTGSVSDGYYYLANSGDWEYATGNTVPVGRGFLVKANAANQTVTLNSQSKGGSDEKGQYICLSIGEEKAYVKLDEGVSMPLLSMKGEQPLYLTRDGKQFVMLVRDDAPSLDLNYKASHNGEQTLKVDLQGNALDYLHLIDHKTGADVDLLHPNAVIAGEDPQSPTPMYTFYAKTTDYASRFKLVFVCGDANDGNETFAYFANGEIIINVVETCHGASLQIVDMMGRVIVSRDGVHTVSTTGMTPGVYVLRLINNNEIKTQKIIINQ